jgi:hypothetical protein
MLEPAAAALPEVRARGVDPRGRAHLDGLEDAPGIARMALGELDEQSIARKAAADEHDEAVDTPDALAAKGEIVDRHGQRIAPSGSRHD